MLVRVKTFITHKLLRRTGQAPKQVSEWLEWLEKEWEQVTLTILVAREGTSGLSYQLAQMWGRKRHRRWGLKAVGSQTT